MLSLGLSGYSTALAFWKGAHSLILGAPRHQHTGKVVIFTQESRHWRPKSEVRGTQVGVEEGRVECEAEQCEGGGGDDGVGGLWRSSWCWERGRTWPRAGILDDFRLGPPDRLLLWGVSVFCGHG